jgi:NADH:ubiquinone oxidoreductase subunit E
MTLSTKNGKDAIQVTQAVVKRHGATRDELIPILTDLNSELGYLSPEVMVEVGKLIGAPRSQLFGVASFYQMLSTKPHGRHVVQFCESAPCHVVGGRQVWQALQDGLKLKSGETSADGKWTLITTSCIGVCAVGPVIVIDEDVHGNVEPGQVADILARYE